jgi:hypothetical protein
MREGGEGEERREKERGEKERGREREREWENVLQAPPQSKKQLEQLSSGSQTESPHFAVLLY